MRLSMGTNVRPSFVQTGRESSILPWGKTQVGSSQLMYVNFTGIVFVLAGKTVLPSALIGGCTNANGGKSWEQAPLAMNDFSSSRFFAPTLRHQPRHTGMTSWFEVTRNRTTEYDRKSPTFW